MDKVIEKRLKDRALELGRAGDGAVLGELIDLINCPSSQVRRLVVSAIGKLAGFADPTRAVAILMTHLHDPHPQVKQYVIKALISYGASAECALHQLRDICSSPLEKEYNKRDAILAVEIISEAVKVREDLAVHYCLHCGVLVTADEYARSHRAFERTFCDKCFDETYLKRRNFDTKVELQKNIPTRKGELVQSAGERIISDFLHQNGIDYRYDERIRIIDGYAIRPDFYLPEFDVYIEYWGMDTADYKIGMLKKQKIYQQESKKLVSVYFSDKHDLTRILTQKLSRYLHFY